MAMETIAAAIGKVLLTKATGTAWDKLAGKKKDALQPLVDKWQASFQSTEAGEGKLSEAFAEFFANKLVADEIEKLADDRYREVDFDSLAEVLKERVEWAGCASALPKDGHTALQEWFGDLRKIVESNQDYRRQHQLGLQGAMRDLSAAQATQVLGAMNGLCF